MCFAQPKKGNAECLFDVLKRSTESAEIGPAASAVYALVYA